MSDLDLEARQAYDDLLEERALASESIAALEEGQEQHGIVFGGAPLSVSLRPSLLSEARWAAAVDAAHGVRSALDTLETALLGDPDLRRELDLDPAEETLALAPPGSRSSSPSVRLDSFFADQVRYVEYNAESPAGIAYGDVLGEVFESLPVMRRFSEKWAVRRLPARESQLGAMMQAFRDWGGSGLPSVAIVDWAGLPTLTEFEMFRSYFATEDIHCCICEPASLSYQDGVLHACDGTPVNLVYRRVLTSELLAREGLEQPLCRAYLDGAAVVVNSFRAKLLHTKMSLALLSDDRYGSLFTPSQHDAIARHVPWTRRMADGPSTRNGEQVQDLVDHVIADRRHLVLKPNDEYGGKGVVLGWTVDDAQWEGVVKTALEECYVVQEAVPVPRETFPTTTGSGEVSMMEMSVDMDPYLFDGEVHGVMTRLSSSALLNVTAGEGSLVPAFVVEGRR